MPLCWNVIFPYEYWKELEIVLWYTIQGLWQVQWGILFRRKLGTTILRKGGGRRLITGIFWGGIWVTIDWIWVGKLFTLYMRLFIRIYLTYLASEEGWDEKVGELTKASSFFTLEGNEPSNTQYSSGYSKTLEEDSEYFITPFLELVDDISSNRGLHFPNPLVYDFLRVEYKMIFLLDCIRAITRSSKSQGAQTNIQTMEPPRWEIFNPNFSL